MDKDNVSREDDPRKSKKGKAPVSIKHLSPSKCLQHEQDNIYQGTTQKDKYLIYESSNVPTTHPMYRQPTITEMHLPSTSKGFYVGSVQEFSKTNPHRADFYETPDVSSNVLPPLTIFTEPTRANMFYHVPSEEFNCIGQRDSSYDELVLATKLKLCATTAVPTDTELYNAVNIMPPVSEEYNRHGKEIGPTWPYANPSNTNNFYVPMHAEPMSDERSTAFFTEHLNSFPQESQKQSGEVSEYRRKLDLPSSLFDFSSTDSSGSTVVGSPSKNSLGLNSDYVSSLDNMFGTYKPSNIEDIKNFLNPTSLSDANTSASNPTNTNSLTTDANITSSLSLMSTDAMEVNSNLKEKEKLAEINKKLYPFLLQKSFENDLQQKHGQKQSMPSLVDESQLGMSLTKTPKISKKRRNSDPGEYNLSENAFQHLKRQKPNVLNLDTKSLKRRRTLESSKNSFSCHNAVDPKVPKNP